jgi:hypothetical protein
MAGRPSEYQREYAEQAEKLCKLGATDVELADFFGVCEATINNWKGAHSEFLESIKRGKVLADAEVASKLYHRAIGYEHPDTHFSSYEGDVTETPMVKHYPPDPTAAIFWLKNRQPAKWREKQTTEVVGPNDGPVQVSGPSYDDVRAAIKSRNTVS